MNNEPAFPCKQYDENGESELKSGISIRDYFAAKAMEVFISQKTAFQYEDQLVIARCSYQMADAMLTEREKEKV